jgi:hypothetical protein
VIINRCIAYVESNINDIGLTRYAGVACPQRWYSLGQRH